MNVEDYSDRTQKRHKIQVIGNWRNGDPYQEVEKTELN